MRILVTNDDGIYAYGIWALANELREVGTVTVVAPDRDQSGAGTSVTLRQPLRLSKVESLLEGVDAYSVEGTPADSVILALRFAMQDGVDLVVSGINEGSNLGNDVFMSGTVGAALQAYFYGIPAIAISITAFENLRFDVASKLAKFLVAELNGGTPPQKLLLNLNLPNLPREKIEGIELTRLGEREYTDMVKPGHDGKREYFWIKRGDPTWHMPSGTDVWAVKQNKISVTPLLNNSGSSNHDFLKNLVPNLSHKLMDSNFELNSKE